MGNEPSGPVVGYTCPYCSFDTNKTYCDGCNSIVRWDSYVGGSATCTDCGNSIYVITCRSCGKKFDL
jgi:hypothetical protein